MIKTKKLKVSYREYSIEQKDEVLEEAQAAARVDKYKHKIEYSANYPDTEVVDSLLHEVLHVLWDLHIKEDEAEEEKAVTMLAHGLTALIKDNPKFIKELMELL